MISPLEIGMFYVELQDVKNSAHWQKANVANVYCCFPVAGNERTAKRRSLFKML